MIFIKSLPFEQKSKHYIEKYEGHLINMVKYCLRKRHKEALFIVVLFSRKSIAIGHFIVEDCQLGLFTNHSTENFFFTEESVCLLLRGLSLQLRLVMATYL